jgi:hypothetical protein
MFLQNGEHAVFTALQPREREKKVENGEFKKLNKLRSGEALFGVYV